jgi:hypothetical protein
MDRHGIAFAIFPMNGFRFASTIIRHAEDAADGSGSRANGPTNDSADGSRGLTALMRAAFGAGNGSLSIGSQWH